LVAGIVGEQLLGCRQAEARAGRAPQIQLVREIDLAAQVVDGGAVAIVGIVVTHAERELGMLARVPNLAEERLRRLLARLDPEPPVETAVALVIVADVVVDALAATAEMEERIEAAVVIAPHRVVVNDDLLPRILEVVEDGVVIRVPPVVV